MRHFLLLFLLYPLIFTLTTSINAPSTITVNSSQYQNDLNDIWLIDLPKGSGVLTLRFVYFDVEEFYDFLEVAFEDGDDWVVVDYIDGFGRNKYYEFEDNRVRVTFVTDSSVTKNGFQFFVGYATCKDGVLNGGESDVDCSGGCSPCSVGRACSSGYDCASGLCDDGVCAGLDVMSTELENVALNGYDSTGQCSSMVHDLDAQSFGHYVSHLHNGFFPNPDGCTIKFISFSYDSLTIYFNGDDYQLETVGNDLLTDNEDETFELDLTSGEATVNIVPTDNQAKFFDRDTNIEFLPRESTTGFFMSFYADITIVEEACAVGHTIDETNIQYNYVISDFSHLPSFYNDECNWEIENPWSLVNDVKFFENNEVFSADKSFSANFYILKQSSDVNLTLQSDYFVDDEGFEYSDQVDIFNTESASLRRKEWPLTEIPDSVTFSTSRELYSEAFYMSLVPAGNNYCGSFSEYKSDQCILLFTSTGANTYDSDCEIRFSIEVDSTKDSSLYFIIPTTGITSAGDGSISISVDRMLLKTITPNNFGFPEIAIFEITETKRLTVSVSFSPGYLEVGLPSKIVVGTNVGLSNCFLQDINFATPETVFTPENFEGHTIFLPRAGERLTHIVRSTILDSSFYVVQSDTTSGKYIHPGSVSPVVNAKIIVVSSKKRIGGNSTTTGYIFSSPLQLEDDTRRRIKTFSRKMQISQGYNQIITVNGNKKTHLYYDDLTQLDFINSNPFTELDDLQDFSDAKGDVSEYHAIATCKGTDLFGELTEYIMASYTTKTKYGEFDTLLPLTSDFQIYAPANSIFGRLIEFTPSCNYALISYSSQLLALVDMVACNFGFNCFQSFIPVRNEFLYGFKVQDGVAYVATCVFGTSGGRLKVSEWTFNGYSDPEESVLIGDTNYYPCTTDDIVSLDVTDSFVAIGIPNENLVIVINRVAEDENLKRDLSDSVYCIDKNSDDLFGTSVYITRQTQELLVTGKSVYIYPLLELEHVNPSLTLCVSPKSSIPNRFLYPGENWDPTSLSSYSIADGAKSYYISESNNSVLIMFSSNPQGEAENSNNFRVLPFSAEGKYSKFIYNGYQSWEIDAECEKGTKKKFSGIALCELCPIGYYQNQKGQLDCEPCPDDRSCPAGSITPSENVSNTVRIVASRFLVTEEDKSMDELMFQSLFGDSGTALHAYFLYCALFLIFLYAVSLTLIYVPVPFFAPMQNILKKCFKELDPDKEFKYNPENQKVEVVGSVKGGMYIMGIIVLFIATGIWGIYYYNGYQYFDQEAENEFADLNNDRKSYYQPEFTASDTARKLLEVLEREPVLISVLLVGYRNIDCEALCDQDFVSAETGGETYSSIVECSIVNLTNCQINWQVGVQLFSEENNFELDLGDLFVEKVEISITTNNNTVDEEIQEGAFVLPSQINVGISLPNQILQDEAEYVLFDIAREFELIRIIQNSDAEDQSVEGYENKWSLQRLFEPTNEPTEYFRFVSAEEYLTSDKNHVIRIKVKKPKSFVYNREKKILQGSELAFGATLLVMAIIGAWDFFFSIGIAIYSFTKNILASKKKDDQEIGLQDFTEVESLRAEMEEMTQTMAEMKNLLKKTRQDLRTLKKSIK